MLLPIDSDMEALQAFQSLKHDLDQRGPTAGPRANFCPQNKFLASEQLRQLKRLVNL